MNQKGFAHLFILLILLLGLGIGLYLVQHPQIFRPRAENSSYDNLATILGKAGNGQALKGLAQASTSTINIPSNALGEQKTAVILMKSQFDREPLTKEQFRDRIFGETGTSINRFYKENSFNKTYFTGEVFGWYPVHFDQGCSTPVNQGLSTSDFLSYAATLAENAAKAAGVDLNPYPKRIYVFTSATCSITGAGTTNRVWLFNPTAFGDLTHEVGHSLGAGHANLLTCGALSIDTYSKCYEQNTGDLWDVMGINHLNFHSSDYQIFQFNGAHKAAMGWIPPENITTAGTDGTTYTIKPTEATTTGTQLLKIQKPDTNEWYYLDYRQPIGFDADLPTAFVNGATLRIWNEDPGTPTKLLDTTPQTPGVFEDAPLSDGNFFYDQINNIKITQVSHNSSEVVVQITSPSLRPHLSAAITGPSVLQPGEAPTFAGQFSSDSGAPSVGDIWLYRLDGKPITTTSCLWSSGPLCRAWTINFTNTTPFTAVNLPNRLEPGDYLGFGMVYDSSGPKCSGAYEILGGDWLDCGDRDVFTLKVL